MFPNLEGSFKGNNVCIITHRLADVDALCSSVVIGNFFKKNNVSKIFFLFPEGLDSIAEQLRKFLCIEFSEPNDFGSFDLIIVVDTGSPKLLGDYYYPVKVSSSKKILIDHHPLTEESIQFYTHYYVDTECSSTCEIVLSLLLNLGFTFDPITSNLLLLGILFDTKHLMLANERTIKNVCFLIDNGARLNWGQDFLLQKRDKSEIIARLKSLSRLNIYEFDSYIVGVVKIGSFQASVAKFLVDAGCDLVLAYSFNDTIKGSLRCSDILCKNNAISLNILAESLAKKFNGVGGGHKCASSFNINCNEEQLFLSTFLSLLENMFSTKARKLSLK
ncbi:MAG: DHH family phosphoesterase [Nitrososphaeria archaeon]